MKSRGNYLRNYNTYKIGFQKSQQNRPVILTAYPVWRQLIEFVMTKTDFTVAGLCNNGVINP